MPATVRYDAQYCPIARALDVLGDRWTLPIVRELVIADQRFSDLRDHLPGVAPSVLSERLRALEAAGVVTTRDGATPRRQLYTLTDRGRATVPILRSLARWGMDLLEERDPSRTLPPRNAIGFAVAAFHDPVAAQHVDERYVFHTGDVDVALSSRTGGTAPDGPTDVELTGPAEVWIDIRQGRLTLDEACKRGEMAVVGRTTSVQNFQRVFAIP